MEICESKNEKVTYLQQLCKFDKYIFYVISDVNGG